MITIKTDEDVFFSLTCEGHAGAERTDNDHDLVCCAVSAIMHTLANSCTRLDGVCTTFHTKPGYSHVAVTGVPKELYGQVLARFTMATDGLEVLAHQYPKCIKFE